MYSNLFLINETLTNGYIDGLLNVISIIAIFFAILVIVMKNPIISVLFLIGLFANISFYLILLGLSFIGLSYLIVYIGAVSILFLFILMLINIRISELQSNNSNSIALSVIITLCAYYPLFGLLPYHIVIINNFNSFLFIFKILKNNYFSTTYYNNDLLFVTSKVWDASLGENSHITSIGNIMYTNYNIWLILASFILLLAMVGAIVITIKQK